jgi:transposase
MILPSLESLKDLTREESISLNAQLIAHLVVLQEQLTEALAQIKQLRAEVDELKKPPTNSRNSSQPPARDWKSNAAPPARRKKRGAKRGHAKAERPLSDHPDRVIEVRATTCVGCGRDLQAVEPRRVLRRQVTELPEITPVVIETRQQEVVCPQCGQLQQGTLPEGLEAMRQFGPRLEALVTYFHHEHHMGFERLQTVLADVLSLTVSEGGAVAILERAGTAAQPEAEVIAEHVRQSPVIGSDETSARVNGHNWWEWVFVSAAGEYHVIEPSRGTDVIETFMGKHWAEVWQSDCWKPQLKAPTKHHQLCLPHQIRNLQGLIDQRPRLRWAREMQDLFRAAVHLHHRRNDLTPLGFRRQVTVMENRLDRLLRRSVTGRVALNLRERYRTHRASLLVCLHRTDVSPDNNACERALRPSVIHRKVMGSFRSEWGPKAYAALASVLNTAKRSGANIFQKLIGLMGKPVLPYLAGLIS